LFKPDKKTKEYKLLGPYKVYSADYFFYLGVIMGIIGFSCFVCYKIWYKDPSTATESETTAGKIQT